MKSGDKDKLDIDENIGLRVSCGKTGQKAFSIDIEAQLMAQLNSI